VRFAYADPPYPGCAGYYPEKREVDHVELIARLVAEFPDGWALSTHGPALRCLLPVCPEDVRVLVWAKPFCSFKPGVGLAYAWEPVIFRGGRPRQRTDLTVRDWHLESITLRRGLVGAKPAGFCHWILDALNVKHGDSVADLFPGTGGFSRIARERCAPPRQLPLALTGTIPCAG
jgi:hypothetical protein